MEYDSAPDVFYLLDMIEPKDTDIHIFTVGWSDVTGIEDISKTILVKCL